MKKMLFVIAVVMTMSAGAHKPIHADNHKFYLSVTKVNYNAEQQALQQQEQAAQMIDMAGAAKALSESQLQEGDSALDRVVSQLPAA